MHTMDFRGLFATPSRTRVSKRSTRQTSEVFGGTTVGHSLIQNGVASGTPPPWDRLSKSFFSTLPLTAVDRVLPRCYNPLYSDYFSIASPDD